MIPQTDLSCQTQNRRRETHHGKSWQRQMIDSVRDANELCHLLELSPEQLKLSDRAARQFPVNVPHSFVHRMEKGNPGDPLLLQVLNQSEEDHRPEGYSTDPVDERAFMAAPGLIHKYSGRVLMIVSGKCAINCRYCFRRSFPYSENNPGRDQWQEAFAYIENERGLSEIIFSGGDPLSAPDKHLAWLTDRLAEISHLKRLRIHTRLPVVIPQRISDELISWLAKSRLKVQLVLHINHPNEINSELAQALDRLKPLGIQTLNQSVLLKGINDSADCLQALQEKAFDAGILPYYLHIMDPVEGASHFDVSEQVALGLIDQLRARLPGYLVPRLVVELAGKSSKTLLC